MLFQISDLSEQILQLQEDKSDLQKAVDGKNKKIYLLERQVSTINWEEFLCTVNLECFMTSKAPKVF